MAERCSLTSLCLISCYKVIPQACEVIISLLRANGLLEKLELMGLGITPLAMEMLASTNTLATLDLCGVAALSDEIMEMVRGPNSHCILYVYLFNDPLPQITSTAGSTLVNFDISSCLSLTDQSCASISRHCVALESLGMCNLKEITGHHLSNFFLDKKRSSNFRSITLSGTKNVCHLETGREGGREGYFCYCYDLFCFFYEQGVAKVLSV